MKTNVIVIYTVCKMRDKENVIRLSVEQYENLIGMLAYFEEVFDIKVDVISTINENDPCQIDLYITHKVVIY